MAGENFLQTLQNIATTVHRLDVLTADHVKFQAAVEGRLDKLEGHIADLRERLARLEASRNADRAEMQADIARFKAEVERAELRCSRLSARSETPRLPEGSEEDS